ncbi:hypothetical protein NEF87_002861 [Candidatus Lokiarchaeum ossiferum]|uniref:Calcineurin-like phosphoesterase domain-containing protein n=1 Tax=Candidatus Lokiarchaeum ossiferum TaxID=2951803 RepID=A0ABY6HVF7_9ARCH|nr:hypothetical protein NEF87_002861 [Candidatus Lokiarchaeum sp. B-35]
MKNLTLKKKKSRVYISMALSFLFLALILLAILIPVIFFEYVRNNVLTYFFFGLEWRISTILLFLFLFCLGIGLVGFKTSIKGINSPKFETKMKIPSTPFVCVGLLLILGIASTSYYVPSLGANSGLSQKYGPYLGFHGDNEMIIAWDSSLSEPALLVYGTEPEHLDLDQESTVEPWSLNDKNFHHYVILTNLTPNSEYLYKIPLFNKEIYHFKTAPLPDSGEPTVFTIVGDIQGGFAGEREMVSQMVQDPDGMDFTCIAGDLVNGDDVPAHWATIFHSKGYGRISASVPWMNVPGNHEQSCENENCGFRENYKLFFQYKYPSNKVSLPNTPDYGLYYSYNYSNVHMVALDNFDNNSYSQVNNYPQGSFLTTAQLEWLDQDLTRNTDMWKFVYMHVPMYSTGDYGSNRILIDQLEPIFEKHHVDAVFYGHDHHFESFYVNRSSTNGTYHFVVGTGGAGTDDLTDRTELGDRAWTGKFLNVSEGEYDTTQMYGSEYQLFGEMTYCYMKVKVVGTIATFSAIRSSDGSSIVEFVISK